MVSVDQRHCDKQNMHYVTSKYGSFFEFLQVLSAKVQWYWHLLGDSYLLLDIWSYGITLVYV